LKLAEESKEWEAAALDGGKPDLQVWIFRDRPAVPLNAHTPIVYQYLLPEL
jgi:hypothetical protein